MKRPPLWTTLIPLVTGVALYHHWWAGKRDAFAREVAAVFGPGATVGGFPYRLEAEQRPAGVTRAAGGGVAKIVTDRLVLDRQPIGDGPVVAHTGPTRVDLAVPPLNARLIVDALSAQSSLRMEGDRVARLSTVFDRARIDTAGVLPVSFADSFEAHFRETPTAARPSRDPRFPVQDEVVLAATGLHIKGGEPLTMAANIDLTAPRAVRALADWRPGGTVELRRLTLADKTGEILAITATLSPGRDGALAVAGTFETVCPQSLLAAFADRPMPIERRTRRPVRISFSGVLPRLPLAAADANGPVRNQEPPCPVLRR